MAPALAAAAHSRRSAAASAACPRAWRLLEAVNESVKWSVSAAVFCAVALRRDALVAYWLIGSMLTAAACRALKAVINQCVAIFDQLNLQKLNCLKIL
jgi:hypothetical protein